jgi:hypothetical protein
MTGPERCRYCGGRVLWHGPGVLHDAELLSVGDSIDTRSPGGRLVLNILASVAQWERATARADRRHPASRGRSALLCPD